MLINVRFVVSRYFQAPQLDHLVHLGVLVAQEEIDALNDREALTEDDRWLLPPPCFFQLHLFFALDAPSSRHVVRRCE